MRTITPVVRAVLMAWRQLAIGSRPTITGSGQKSVSLAIMRALPETDDLIITGLTTGINRSMNDPAQCVSDTAEVRLYTILTGLLLWRALPDQWWAKLVEDPTLTDLREQYQRCLGKPMRIVEDTNMLAGADFDLVHTMTDGRPDVCGVVTAVIEIDQWKMTYCLVELELDTPVLEALYHARAFDR